MMMRGCAGDCNQGRKPCVRGCFEDYQDKEGWLERLSALALIVGMAVILALLFKVLE